MRAKKRKSEQNWFTLKMRIELGLRLSPRMMARSFRKFLKPLPACVISFVLISTALPNVPPSGPVQQSTQLQVSLVGAG